MDPSNFVVCSFLVTVKFPITDCIALECIMEHKFSQSVSAKGFDWYNNRWYCTHHRGHIHNGMCPHNCGLRAHRIIAHADLSIYDIHHL